MIAYGAIACNLAAAEDRDRRAHRVQPHRRRGQPPARLVTRRRAVARARRRLQGLPRPAAAAHRAARRSPPASTIAHSRPRSAGGRSVRQPRDRRDAARRGEVRVFGRPTSAIADSADWLATVDRFGIVSERAVLLEALTVVQNLAMPFTLEIEPPPPDDPRAGRRAGARGRARPRASWDRPRRRARCGRRACASGWPGAGARSGDPAARASVGDAAARPSVAPLGRDDSRRSPSDEAPRRSR